ncbi:Lachrymatory-factor synthase precursor, putative [Ricinus communis]|uniref:Lachrymatory-factor synthase, putative n=1 Tax=Ricinus communis TaxID=3988 RepID=B9RS03_RICCO|nr:Lachrymatory-factor synthase precursor, putative [Ricinus communis]
MEQNQQPKWEAKFTKRLTKAKAEQIWPLFTDFFNLNRWFPSIPTCYGIHGTNGELGCIRYCGGFSIPSDPTEQHQNDSNLPVVSWSKEKLIAIEHAERCLSYEIIDSNIGYKSYVAVVKIVPAKEEEGGGCVIEWSFTVNPVEGCVFDDIVSTWDMAIQIVADRMEDEAKKVSEQQPLSHAT